jgi:hypothetical protein
LTVTEIIVASMMGCGFLVLIAYGAWRALR